MKKEKSQHRKKVFRRWLALCLLVLAAGILTACGGTADDRSLGIDGVVYMARELELPGEASIFNLNSRDGYLYYQAGTMLMRLSPDSNDDYWAENRVPVLECPSSSEKAYRIRGYAAGHNGDLYYCRQNWTWNKSGMSVSENHVLLIRQSADGNTVYETPIPVTDIPSELRCGLAVDDEDRAYLLAENHIYVVDASGELAGTISTEEYVQNQSFENEGQLLTGSGGQIYFLTRYPDTVIYKVIADGGWRLEEKSELTQNMSGIFYGSPYGLLCDKADGILYQYHEDDSTWHPLLRWTDGNMGGQTGNVLQLSEDYIATLHFTESGSLASMEDESSLYLLTRTPVTELPEKEILVLASISPSASLKQSVMDFNRSSSQYHILLDIYEGSEATVRLDAAMVSSDPPDLLDTSSLNLTKYAQKQALADLAPYLDQSKVLSRDYFLPSLLEGYTIDGRLCSIPAAFTLQTIMGRPDQIGSNAGWTMADVMALAEKYPDYRLIGNNNFYYLLNIFCSYYILEEYIDWEGGTCRFDSPQFCELIRWIWAQSEESGRLPADEYLFEAMPEDALLVTRSIFSPYNYALTLEKMGGTVTTMIGYPTADGHELHGASARDELCITASSKHKEAAWTFMEFFLSRNFFELYSFPTRMDILTQLIEEEATPTYLLDENGEIRYDNNGEPMIKTRLVEYTSDGMRTEYLYLERENADALLEMIKHLDFTPGDSRERTAAAIISEELDSWLSHDKSLEEAAAIIQSRVQLMLDEGA